MVWYTVRCSYNDWQRDYKRSHRVAHDHDAQKQFVLDAKTAAVNELHSSGQGMFANVQINNIDTTGIQVNLGTILELTTNRFNIDCRKSLHSS